MRSPFSCLRSLLGGLLLLSSCTTLGFHDVAAGPKICVHASSRELREEVSHYLHDLVPQVAQMFDATDGRPIVVLVKPDEESLVGAESGPGGITVFKTGPVLPAFLAHELVHTFVRHQESSWNVVPPIVEEGLAYLIEYGVHGAREAVIQTPPTQEVLTSVLGMSFEDYNEVHGDEKQHLIEVATYTAATIGFDKLRALSIRAHSGGLHTIPSSWILRGIDASEKKRRSHEHPDLALPPVSIDPLFGRIKIPGRKGRLIIDVKPSTSEESLMLHS